MDDVALNSVGAGVAGRKKRSSRREGAFLVEIDAWRDKIIQAQFDEDLLDSFFDWIFGIREEKTDLAKTVLPYAARMIIECLQTFEQTIRAFGTDDSQIIHRTAVLCECAFLYKDAFDYYQRNVALRPNCGASHYYLAWFFEDTGQIREAAAEFKKALDVDPLFAVADWHLAWIYKKDGQYASALYHFRHFQLFNTDESSGMIKKEEEAGRWIRYLQSKINLFGDAEERFYCMVSDKHQNSSTLKSAAEEKPEGHL